MARARCTKAPREFPAVFHGASSLYWEKVSDYLGIYVRYRSDEIYHSANGRSFAWAEVLKAMALLFKLYDVERSHGKPTVLREGFFNKATECEVVLRRCL